MKNVSVCRIAVLLCFGLIASLTIEAKDNKHAKESKENSVHSPQILIVGLEDNVKSNYFYNGMIAEETGMEAESIDREYNHIIAENIAESLKNGKCRFITAEDKSLDKKMINGIKVTGEEEACSSDLSSIPAEDFRKTLDEANADYLLVLNRHYLKWQEEPFRTLFHIVSYSLFDKEKNEVYSGNNFFTCMDLEQPSKLKKSSRKVSSKIATSVLKSLDVK